jgi:hypothetical protein
MRATRAQEKTELAIYSHHLEARYLSEVDRIDSQAISDVTKAALEEEMNVLDWGLEQAAGSQAKAELVSRMVSMQSKIDSARITRRFGG